jgi:hypothetical protein
VEIGSRSEVVGRRSNGYAEDESGTGGRCEQRSVLQTKSDPGAVVSGVGSLLRERSLSGTKDSAFSQRRRRKGQGEREQEHKLGNPDAVALEGEETPGPDRQKRFVTEAASLEWTRQGAVG